MYSFEQIDIDKIDIEEYYGFEKKSPFTTLPWLRFLIEDNKANPVIVRITDNNELIGYFTGLTIRKFGIKIFGSPFKGWSTCFMGYDLFDYSLIKELLEPTIEFIYKKTKCHYIEIVERNLNPDDMKNIKYKTEITSTLEIDIDKTDEELMKSFDSRCRTIIRQFEKNDAIIEIAEPNEKYIEEIYDQLCDVFLKQNLASPYSMDKMKIFIKNLRNGEMLFCVKVLDPDGKNIASTIFYGYNKICFGWCTASYREAQHFRPNEQMIWFGLRYLRDAGYKVFDYAGKAKYKYKYYPTEVDYLRITATKYPILITLRNLAQKTFWIWLKIRGTLKKITVKNLK